MLNKHLYDKDSSIFQRYIALTTQKPILAHKVVSKIETQFPNKVISFLDIGCGDGTVTISVLEKLAGAKQVTTTCIEPSRDLINDFRQNTDIKVKFIEKNVETLSQLPKSDFILISHVLSYVKNPRALFDKVFKALTTDGITLVVVNNPNSDDSIIKRQLSIDDDNTNLSIDLQAILGQQKTPHHVEIVESTIDVSGCKSMNYDGKTIIEFFKHQRFEDIPSNDIAKMRNAILSLATTDNLLIKREDYIWIKKR